MATKDHVRGGQDADGARLREPSVSIRLCDGTVSDRPLWQVTARQVADAVPWRMTRSARSQLHYRGSTGRRPVAVTGTTLLHTSPDRTITQTADGVQFARDVRPVLDSLAQSREKESSHTP